MTDMDKRELIADQNPDAIVFDNPAFDNSIIGVTEDGRAVYDFYKMTEELAADEGLTLEDAADFIGYNTIRALPYAGEYAPVIMYPIE